MQNMTIEMWIKDFSQLNSTGRIPMILFENSGDSRTSIVQISIYPGTTNDLR